MASAATLKNRRNRHISATH